MKQLLIATKNKGKVLEFESLFSNDNVEILSLLDFPAIADIEETGGTFQDNARIKAETIADLLNHIVLADDSGLVVDALNGAPGVYSARYAGEAKNDQDNIDKLLVEMSEVPWHERVARFHCSLAVAFPHRSKQTMIVDGTCEGKITTAPKGENGFGYDPVFFVESFGKTMAQLDKLEKNRISHRKAAMNQLISSSILNVK